MSLTLTSMREGSTWKVPRPSRRPPRGIGVASATSAGILTGQVKLRISSRVPRTWKRAAGSTESSTIFVPPSSNSAWRTATSGRSLRLAAGGGSGAAVTRGRAVSAATSESWPRSSRSTSAHGLTTRTSSTEICAGAR